MAGAVALDFPTASLPPLVHSLITMHHWDTTHTTVLGVSYRLNSGGGGLTRISQHLLMSMLGEPQDIVGILALDYGSPF